MRPTPPSIDELLASPATWVAGALLALFLLQTARLWFVSSAPARAQRRRLERASRGEAEALSLVESLGYAVIDEQATRRLSVWVDGEPREVRIRPDLIVARDGKLFAADVKTGGVAPDPLYPPTRRQLLEYALSCEVDGVLLIDMEQRRVRELRFALPASQGRVEVGWGWVALALVIGVVTGAAGGVWWR